MHILIVGNPGIGFEFYGPFEFEEDAIEYGEESHGIIEGGVESCIRDWWVARLKDAGE